MKRIMCFGDSNTHGYNPAGPTRYEYDVRWTGRLAKALGEDYMVIEAGLNGMTAGFDDPDKPNRNGQRAIGYFLHANKPLDFIVVMAGTNDAWFLDKRPHALEKTAQQVFSDGEPTISKQPSTMLTLAESIRYNCELLQRCFPQARIVLVAPLQSVQAARHLGAVNQIIEDCARQMNIGVIRLDRLSGISSASESKTKRYTTDGTHTSVEGARRCARCIVTALGELLKGK